MSSDVAIRVESLSKCYQIYDKPRDRLLQGIMPRLQRIAGRQPRQYCREFWALKDVSFDVKKGETVGIIGRNGSGKSTLLQLICGTLAPTIGTIQTNGRVAALLELGAGFNPEFSGRENVYMNALILGLAKDEIDAQFDKIANFADIGDYLDQPVKTYSSGMFARLAFSTAIHVSPTLLILDEILAVGDVVFQKKCLDKINEIRQSGCTVLMVSHDPYQIRSVCNRSLLLDKGAMIGFGDTQDMLDNYKNILFDLDRNNKPANFKTINNTDYFNITIDSVKMFTVDGEETYNINSGDSVIICFEYSIINHEVLEGITFVVNLYSQDGTYVFGTTTLMSGHDPYKAHNKGQVKVAFPNLNLLSGSYNWRVAINGVDELGALAEAVPVCIFKVRDNFRAVGIVELPHFWDIEQL